MMKTGKSEDKLKSTEWKDVTKIIPIKDLAENVKLVI